MTIYQPAEDTYLMQRVLKEYLQDKPKSIKILDMGSGLGIQAQTCKDLGFNNLLTTDINPEVINLLKEKSFKSIQSDLFSNIKEKFNLIIFNPPYLPFDEKEPEDSQLQTTGGKKGYEIIVRFLSEVREHLSNKGVVLLLFSSLSEPKIILRETERFNYKVKLLGKEKLFFEELFVYLITTNS